MSICPKCKSSRFYQNGHSCTFHCKDCDTTFQLVDTDKISQLAKEFHTVVANNDASNAEIILALIGTIFAEALKFKEVKP